MTTTYALQWSNIIMTVCEITDEFLTDMQTAATPAVERTKAAVGNDALYDTLYQLLDGGESA